MSNIASPEEYIDVALILVYSPGDSILINSDKGTWNGETDLVDDLQKIFENVNVQYFSQQECLLLYIKESGCNFEIDVTSDTQYFFAEVNEQFELTDLNTEDDESLLPYGRVVVEKNSENVISIIEKNDVGIQQDIPINPTTDQTTSDYKQVAVVQNENAMNNEIIRLQGLVTQLLDEKYNEVYALVNDAQINQKAENLYKLKLEYEKIRVSRDEEKLKFDSLNESLQNLQAEKERLEAEISTIEGLAKYSDSEIIVLNQKLKVLLDDLGIDLGVLEQYRGTTEVDSLIKQVNDMREQVEQLLKERIAVRQQICQAKHDKIAGV